MEKRVLVLCTGNSCRSQMAEGIINTFIEGWKAESAGTKPSFVHPKAILVCNEIGVDLSQNRSKSVDEFDGQDFDLVVTVCGNANESCPTFIGKYTREHWGFEDPADATGSDEDVLNVFREIRDQIKNVFTTHLK